MFENPPLIWRHSRWIRQLLVGEPRLRVPELHHPRAICDFLRSTHGFPHPSRSIPWGRRHFVSELRHPVNASVFHVWASASASPIYWFDITAQEKAAIDRLYAFGGIGFPFHKTALLLDSHSDGVYDAAIAQYKATCAYCEWEDQGIVTISGMTERDSMATSPKLDEVRALARKLA